MNTFNDDFGIDNLGQGGTEQADNNEDNKGSVRVVSGSGFRYVVPFPWRLHQMLEEIEKAGEDNIVSWLQDGMHFQVHNPQLFVQHTIPKFFKQKSYKSFQRQLHLYGFQRVLEGPNRGAYFHESFLKENRKLSLEISRIKAPKRRRPPVPPVKKEMPQTSVQTKPKDSISSVLDRFQPLSQDNSKVCLPVSPTPLSPTPLPAQATRSVRRPDFDPMALFRQNCCSYQNCTHRRNNMPAQNKAKSQDDGSVAHTYEWLINAGVPFSAFDPVAITSSHSVASGVGDLFDCADEITSLFSSGSGANTPTQGSPMAQRSVSELSDVTNDDAFASIDILDETNPHFSANLFGDLSDITPAIWGL